MANKLLERQIKRFLKGYSEIPAELNDFIGAVSSAYDHYEADRDLLERALENSSSELTDANKRIAQAYKEIEEKNRDMISSISYAKMIQDAIFPPEQILMKLLPESFIFHRSKDIVGGDFYWIDEQGGKVLISAIDCTGHGVPGAFMSIVGYNLLNSAFKEHRRTTPSQILDELKKGVSNTLRQTHEFGSVKDGMDVALCVIDKNKMELQFAGAYNPLYLVRDGRLIETKANKFPVGISYRNDMKQFTNHIFKIEPGDCYYIFSDGFADQFGGPVGKKFKYDRFKSLLVDISDLACHDQKRILEQTFLEWKGNLEQVDDTLVIGMKF